MKNLTEIKGNLKKTYILGAKWKTYFFDTQSQKRKKINDFISTIDKPSVTTLTGNYGESCSVGFVVEPLNGQYHSFSGAIAQTYKEAVHLYEINKEFWLIWCEGGIILENGEISFSSVEKIREYIKTNILPISPDITFYGDRLLSPSNVKKFIDYELSTVLVEIREKNSLFYKKYISKKDRIIFSSVMLLIIIFSSIAINYYQQYKEKEDFYNSKITVKTDSEKAVEREKRSFFDSLVTYGEKVPPRIVLQNMNESIKDIPVTYKGWKVEKIICTVEYSTCSINWQSKENGTFREFFNYFKKYRIDFNPSGKSILMELDFKNPIVDIDDAQVLYDELPSKIDFYNTHISSLQYLERSGVFNFVVSEEKSSISTSAKILKGRSLGATFRQWEIKGKGYYYIMDLANYLPDISFTIDNLEINYSIGVYEDIDIKPENWIIRGRYVHKS